MSFLADLWATLKIAQSNYTYHFGHMTNIILAVLIIALLVFSFYNISRLPKYAKKPRSIDPKLPPEDEIEHAAQSLSRAVRCETVTGNTQELKKLIEYFKNRYPDVFDTLTPFFMPSGSLILHWKAAGEKEVLPVLFCGHMDVVPAGKDWNKPAFGGSVDEENIHGRGTLDCKNVVVSLLEAVDKLVRAEHTPKRDIYFAFGSDEEQGGVRGAAEMADFFDKRDLRFDFIMDEGGNITTAHMGSKFLPAAVIAVGEKAALNVKITAKSKGGHSAHAPKHTAAGIISEAVCRIENAPMRKRLLTEVYQYLRNSSPVLNFSQRYLVANVRLLKPFLYNAFRRDNEIFSMFRTTFAVTQLTGSNAPNVLPTTASAVINVRILQGDTKEKVKAHIEGLLADLPITVELMGDAAPSKISATTTPQYNALCAAISECFGAVECIPTIICGGTDTRHYAHMTDNIFRFAPMIISPKYALSVHASDEKIKRQSLGAAVNFYHYFIKSL